MPPPRKRESALTSSSSTDRSRVGRLGRPHGLDGHLGIYVDDDDLTHFEIGATVYVGDQPHQVRDMRQGKKGPQVAFEGVGDRTTAEQIRNLPVFVDVRRELGKDEYWPEDLIGLEVVTTDGKPLGEVTDIVSGPAQDRLVVEGDGEPIEIPMVKDLVPTVDIDGGRIEVVSMPGLTEPET